MEQKIGVIGSKDRIYFFKMYNFEIFPINTIAEGEEIIKKIKNLNFSILFITEDWEEKLRKELEPLKNAPLPAIITLPLPFSNKQQNICDIKKIVERTIGSNIIDIIKK